MERKQIRSDVEKIVGECGVSCDFDRTFGEMGMDSADYMKMVTGIECKYENIDFKDFFEGDSKNPRYNSLTPGDIVSYIHGKTTNIDPFLANF